MNSLTNCSNEYFRSSKCHNIGGRRKLDSDGVISQPKCACNHWISRLLLLLCSWWNISGVFVVSVICIRSCTVCKNKLWPKHTVITCQCGQCFCATQVNKYCVVNTCINNVPLIVLTSARTCVCVCVCVWIIFVCVFLKT